MLNPAKRIPKVTPIDSDVILDIGPRLELGGDGSGTQTGLSITIPKGIPAARLGNLRHKELIDDLALAVAQPDAIVQKHGEERAAQLNALLREMIADPKGVVNTLFEHADLIRALYSNDTELVENFGHRFGEDLDPQQKRDLTAFLATL
jgi:hypothetical protein